MLPEARDPAAIREREKDLKNPPRPDGHPSQEGNIKELIPSLGQDAEGRSVPAQIKAKIAE